jgi:hypothetical protein
MIILSTVSFAENLYLDREQKKNLIFKISSIGGYYCRDILIIKQHAYIDGYYLITCQFLGGGIYEIGWIPDRD